jgi:hypothetical protein
MNSILLLAGCVIIIAILGVVLLHYLILTLAKDEKEIEEYYESFRNNLANYKGGIDDNWFNRL